MTDPAKRSWLLGAFTVVVVIFLIAPIVVVCASSLTSAAYVSFPPVGLSVRWYIELWNDAGFTRSLVQSLELATYTAIVSTIIGAMAALALVRYEFRFRDALNALLLSPLMIPGLVLGVAILQVYARSNAINSMVTLVLGHIAIATPYVVRLAVASLVGFDRRLELAAQNLGASPVGAFMRITLPIVLPGLIGGTAFAFIISFEDVNVSLFLSNADTVTLPVNIYNYVSQQSSPIISAAGSLLAFIVLAVAIVVDRLVGLRTAVGK